MNGLVRIGLIGDFDPGVTAHLAIPRALRLAAEQTWCDIEVEWILTRNLADDTTARLAPFRGLWCTPGSPYENPDGALSAIRFARESGRSFLGTCAGFQHALLEYARNVLGEADADHAETNPGTRMPVIAPLACALVERSGSIRLSPGSRIRSIYDRPKTEEVYHCRFGPNPEYENMFETGGLRICGRDPDGETRAVELPTHHFFLATLFQPERSAATGKPHPLVAAFLNAAGTAAEEGRKDS
jgi:CTP synthase (UTP-ammonia lyase)